MFKCIYAECLIVHTGHYKCALILVYGVPQEVHARVRAVAAHAHSRRGTVQVQVLLQVIRQVGPLEQILWQGPF